MARQKKEESIIIKIAAGQLVYISDIPSFFVNNPPVVYHAKLLKYADDVMTFAFCARKGQGMEYEAESSLAVMFIEFKENFLFTATVKSVRALREDDMFSVHEMIDFIDDIYTAEAYDAFIVELIPMSQIIKHQRRAYYRSSISVDIYYKPISEYEARITDSKAKYASQDRAEEKKKAEEGYYEEELGYGKLQTIDISAGGFKFLSAETFELHSYFDCMIMLEYEALPVIAKVMDFTEARDRDRRNYVHCMYCDLSDTIRDRIMKFIFEQERRMQRRLGRR